MESTDYFSDLFYYMCFVIRVTDRVSTGSCLQMTIVIVILSLLSLSSSNEGFEIKWIEVKTFLYFWGDHH